MHLSPTCKEYHHDKCSSVSCDCTCHDNPMAASLDKRDGLTMDAAIYLAVRDPSKLFDQMNAADALITRQEERECVNRHEAEEWLVNVLTTFGWPEAETRQLILFVNERDAYGRTEE